MGLIPDYARRANFAGMKAGDTLVLIGETRGELGASLYLREVLGREDGAPPPVDLAAERRNGDFVRNLIKSGQVTVAHDLSDGGLVAAAADLAIASNVGVKLALPAGLPAHAALFGEDQARYLLATPSPDSVLAAARAAGVPASFAGVANGASLAAPGLFDLSVTRLRDAREAWMPSYM